MKYILSFILVFSILVPSSAQNWDAYTQKKSTKTKSTTTRVIPTKTTPKENVSKKNNTISIIEKQEKREIQKPVLEQDNKAYDFVDQMPSFPGGFSALKEYISSQVNYPTIAQENDVRGRVIVGFIVEKDSTISNVRILKSIDSELDKEAKRVVECMPKWIPGKKNGECVRVKCNTTVTFGE